MKPGKCFAGVILLMLPFTFCSAQDKDDVRADSAAIRQTALDYVDGFYSGDVGRIEKAVHPDFNKATPRDLPQTGRTTLAYTTYSGLVELTRAKAGALDDTARHIQVRILRFKYIGQMTEDRPSVEYLMDYIQKME